LLLEGHHVCSAGHLGAHQVRETQLAAEQLEATQQPIAAAVAAESLVASSKQ
jgi:hypothetical protein